MASYDVTKSYNWKRQNFVDLRFIRKNVALKNAIHSNTYSKISTSNQDTHLKDAISTVNNNNTETNINIVNVNGVIQKPGWHWGWSSAKALASQTALKKKAISNKFELFMTSLWTYDQFHQRILHHRV